MLFFYWIYRCSIPTIKRFHFYDITFSFLRGNVSVTTIQRFRFYDVKFAFLYRNGNSN